MRQTWDEARVTAVLAALKDNGVSVQNMTRWSGLHRSTIYRWMRGDGGQPDYHHVGRLAEALWRRGYAGPARELSEASGYAWAEPQDEPEPDPVPADVLRVISQAVARGERSQEWADDAIAALTAIGRGRRGEELPPPSERHAG